MKTPAQRKAAERARRAKAGLKRLELWVPEWAFAPIKRYAEKLVKRGRRP